MTLDALGRAVTDPNGRSVEYAWGSSGERTGITYPDGRMVQYHYDEVLRLSELRNGETVLHYRYDKEGRLSGKELPNGVMTEYEYQADGCLKSLHHRHGDDVLEGYRYGYDRLGNRTEPRMMRSGLEEESGTWRYAYDALSRLTGVEKNGTGIRSYGYDAFGNRSVQRELTTGKETVYTYNGLNQLMRSETGETRQEYGYDLRGNLTDITENGVVKNQYEYGAENRLIKALGSHGEEALYQYNGLGMRTVLLVDEAGDILFDNSNGIFIEMARAIYNKEGFYSLTVKFKEEVSDDLSEITQKNIGKKIMVILDDEIYASPVIEQKIDDGELLMSRIDTIEQAKLLEEIWNSQCLPCEFERCK